MKNFWYVLVEMYESGTVKANVIKSRLSNICPSEFYKKEYGREIFGEWFDSEAEADEAAAEARALNGSLVNKWIAA
jgi:hypothetical protein